MSYSFEDNPDSGLLEDDSVETSARLTRGGVPRWLLAVLGAGAFALFLSARSNLPTDDGAVPSTTSPIEGFPASTSTRDDPVQPLNTSPRNQLTHTDVEWTAPGVGPDRAIALRSDGSVLVIDPAAERAHRIELPSDIDTLDGAAVDFRGATISLVAGKLITYGNGFLRSLSVNGGVDVLLSNSSLGFEVATPTAILAATKIVSSADQAPQIRLAVQGVHFPTGRDEVVAFGVADLDTLPTDASVVATKERLFVQLDGAIFRDTEDGLVRLGDGRIFSSSPDAVIIEHCVAVFAECSYSLVDLDDPAGTEVRLDVPFSFARSDVVMSTDGNTVLVQDDLQGTQMLVDIGTGTWNVLHQFDLGRLDAIAFDHATATWVLVIRDSIVFWDGESQGVWQIPDFGDVDEIFIAQHSFVAEGE